MPERRVFILVIDAWGVGALPDAPDYGDSLSANTMGSIDAAVPGLNLPTLQRLGLGNLLPLTQIPPEKIPLASTGKMAEQSKGKDTTTGHWEMAGITLTTPFPTYPDGFPDDVITAFKAATGVKGVLGNCPASGTEIIQRLGEEHLKTGHPIVYTSADSVFQIAAHVGPESQIDLGTLYHWCETARNLLTDQHEVSRVIARPFEGQNAETFTRISKSRRDYAVLPPEKTALNRIEEAGGIVVSVGKIEDIFCFSGITHSSHTGSNADGIVVMNQLASKTLPLDSISLSKKPLDAFPLSDKQLIFVNLVETDSHYGHRRDAEGYARALEAIDAGLAELLTYLTADDLLMISADHGCDPTAPGSDHTREYVPILMYNNQLPGSDLGIRASFADIGKTTLDWLNLDDEGQSGISMLTGQKQIAPVK
ncbi:MAG: phosphopentomutase [Cyanobacteria bacterium P01_H01_bin.74]